MKRQIEIFIRLNFTLQHQLFNFFSHHPTHRALPKSERNILNNCCKFPARNSIELSERAASVYIFNYNWFVLEKRSGRTKKSEREAIQAPALRIGRNSIVLLFKQQFNKIIAHIFSFRFRLATSGAEWPVMYIHPSSSALWKKNDDKIICNFTEHKKNCWKRSRIEKCRCKFSNILNLLVHIL